MTLRNNRALRFPGPAVIILAFALLAPTVAQAAEVEEGTVINAANLSSLMDKEFEGKTIGSMLTENIQWMIREQGLTMTLRHSEEVPVDPRWIEATKKYSGDVSYDPATRLVSGYKAGLCFPDISLDDPHAADKIMWNAYYIGGWPRGDLANYPLFAFLFINGDKGLERVQHWALIRSFLKGRLDGEPVIGDGSIDFKQLLFAHYPYDIRGIGTFAIRYGNGKYDDSWAYLRTVRRTRRLSGGTWHDPIGGTDQLNDEVEINSAFPTWYTGFKLLEKRWILAVAHSRWPVWDQDKKKPVEAFPLVDLENKPYWNPLDDWEPREVYVIDAATPDTHPYSRKVMYLDTKTWVYYLGEFYDKKGEFWKVGIFNMRPIKTEDGGWGVISNQGHTIDFKRRHATIFAHGKQSQFNTPGVGPEDVSLEVLEAAGQGRWRVPE